MSRSFYAACGLALMLLIAIAPAFVGSLAPAGDGPLPVVVHDAAPAGDAVAQAVDDLAAWPVAATR